MGVITAPLSESKSFNQILPLGLSTQDANSLKESKWPSWGPAFLSLANGGQKKSRVPQLTNLSN